jgi:hypothetical protein
MSRLTWERYVARLCLDAWALEPAALIKVMSDIESLIAAGYVTDASIATVLRLAGVPHADAELIAPTLRSAIEDDGVPPHAYPPVM